MKAASLSARLDRMPMVKAVAPFAAGILAADCFTLPLWFLAGAFLLSGTLALLLHSQSGALVMLLTAGFAASQLRDTAPTLPARESAAGVRCGRFAAERKVTAG